MSRRSHGTIDHLIFLSTSTRKGRRLLIVEWPCLTVASVCWRCSWNRYLWCFLRCHVRLNTRILRRMIQSSYSCHVREDFFKQSFSFCPLLIFHLPVHPPPITEMESWSLCLSAPLLFHPFDEKMDSLCCQDFVGTSHRRTCLRVCALEKTLTLGENICTKRNIVYAVPTCCLDNEIKVTGKDVRLEFLSRTHLASFSCNFSTLYYISSSSQIRNSFY